MNFKEFLKLEEKSNTFKDSVKFSNSDFEKWKNAADNAYNYDNLSDLILIYKKNDHVGTYNSKTNILDTDNVKIFGN